jgi:hypothetical protein
VNREAMAILERDDWPGNVREREAVVRRAMVRRRRGWVTPEDIVPPRLRRERLAEAMRGLPLRPSAAQTGALRIALGRGEVRRRDVVARVGVSGAVAQRALAGLERAGLVRGAGARGALRPGAADGRRRACRRARDLGPDRALDPTGARGARSRERPRRTSRDDAARPHERPYRSLGMGKVARPRDAGAWAAWCPCIVRETPSRR